MNASYIYLIEKVLNSFKHEFGDDGELDLGESFVVSFDDGVVVMDMEDPFCVSFNVIPGPPANIKGELGISFTNGPYNLFD